MSSDETVWQTWTRRWDLVLHINDRACASEAGELPTAFPGILTIDHNKESRMTIYLKHYLSVWLSICLFVCLSFIYLSICLSVCLSNVISLSVCHLFVLLSVHQSARHLSFIYLSIYLSICLSVCHLSVLLSIYLSIYLFICLSSI